MIVSEKQVVAGYRGYWEHKGVGGKKITEHAVRFAPTEASKAFNSDKIFTGRQRALEPSVDLSSRRLNSVVNAPYRERVMLRRGKTAEFYRERGWRRLKALDLPMKIFIVFGLIVTLTAPVYSIYRIHQASQTDTHR